MSPQHYKTKAMTTTENICVHRVEFNYHTNSKNAFPNELEIEHVQTSIIVGYVEGELLLNKIINNRSYEFRGWWKIIRD